MQKTHKSEFARLVEAARSSGKKAPDKVSSTSSSSLPEDSSSVEVSEMAGKDDDRVVDKEDEMLED